MYLKIKQKGIKVRKKERKEAYVKRAILDMEEFLLKEKDVKF